MTFESVIYLNWSTKYSHSIETKSFTSLVLACILFEFIDNFLLPLSITDDYSRILSQNYYPQPHIFRTLTLESKKSVYKPCVQKWIGTKSSKIDSECEHPMHAANRLCILSRTDRDTWFATRTISIPNDFQSSKSWHAKCSVALVTTTRPDPFRIWRSIPWWWLPSQRFLRHSIRWMVAGPFWIAISVYGRHSGKKIFGKLVVGLWFAT